MSLPDFPELVVIMVVILLLFGAKRIPEVAGSVGKGIKEFKKQINGLENDATGKSASYPPPRLTGEDLQRTQPPVTTEAEPTEPKRLI